MISKSLLRKRFNHRFILLFVFAMTSLFGVFALTTVSSPVHADYLLSAPPVCSDTEVGGTVYREFNIDGSLDGAVTDTTLHWDDTPRPFADPVSNVNTYWILANSRPIASRYAEQGMDGVTVNVYGDDAILLGSTTTGAGGLATGEWVIDVGINAPATVLVEFLLPDGFSSGPNGNNNQTSITTASLGECTVDFTLGYGDEHCQDAPELGVTCFELTDPSQPTLIEVGYTTSGQLIRQQPYSLATNEIQFAGYGSLQPTLLTTFDGTKEIQATMGDVGNVFGYAWDKRNDRIFVSSFERAKAALLDDGVGGYHEAAIFAVSPDGLTQQMWLDLEDLLGADIAGVALPNPALGNFDHNMISHISLGDMDISADGRELYVVNLASREIYIIPIGPDGSPPTDANQITRFLIPDECSMGGWDDDNEDLDGDGNLDVHEDANLNGVLDPGEDLDNDGKLDYFMEDANSNGTLETGDGIVDRPYHAVLGLGVHPASGRVYATSTCTGPTRDELVGYVYSFDTSAIPPDSRPTSGNLAPFTREVTTSLYNISNPSMMTCQTASGIDPFYEEPGYAWFPLSDPLATFLSAWQTGYTGGCEPTDNASFRSAVFQPWMADIVFDVEPDGDVFMLVSSRNRISDAFGFVGLTAGGNIYMACGGSTGSWTLESNGVCDTKVTGSDLNLAMYQKLNNHNASFYDSVGAEGVFSNGTMIAIPGFTEIVVAGTDNVARNNHSGLAFMRRDDGQRTRDSLLIEAGDSDVYKANAWGDIGARCEPAPLEIGNYVWYDDGDGIQEAGEQPVANVSLNLYRDENGNSLYEVTDMLVATAVTDADGFYYFQRNISGTTGLVSNGSGFVTDENLDYDTNYLLAVDNPVDFASGGVLFGHDLAPANVVAGGDSDGADDVNNNNAEADRYALGRSADGLRDSDAVNGGNEAGNNVVAFSTGAPGESEHSYDFGFVGYDYGDLPDGDGAGLSYPTNNVDGGEGLGARHLRDGSLYLGACVDVEGDGQPDLFAGGDDGNLLGIPGRVDGICTIGDEDGLTGAGDWSDGSGQLDVIVTDGDGCFNFWLDWGDGTTASSTGDGDFDPADHVIINEPVAAGLNQLTFSIPAGSANGASWYARGRLTPLDANGDCVLADAYAGGSVSPSGTAQGGEVEDILFSFSPTSVQLQDFTSHTEHGQSLGFVIVSAILILGLSLRMRHRLVNMRQQQINH